MVIAMKRLSRLVAALGLFSLLVPVAAVADFQGPPFIPPIGIAQGGAGAFGVLYSAAGTVTAAGSGYAPGDTATLTGGTFATAGVLAITDTQAVAGTVAAAGSGGSNGACTVTGTTGTGTKAQFAGTVSGGALTGPLSVAVAGDYTVNPTAISAEPVTGCALTGAQVNMTIGALSFGVQRPGNYSAVPASPVAQGSSSGAGTGATFTLSFGPLAALIPYDDLNPAGGNYRSGLRAGQSLTTGREDMMIGLDAGTNTTTGGNVTALGLAALKANTTGSNLVCAGTDCMKNSNGQGSSVGYGVSVMKDWVSSFSVGIGVATMAGNPAGGITSGDNNIAIGANANLSAATATAPNNLIAIGNSIGDSALTSASFSVLIGNNTGHAITSAGKDVFVGHNTGKAATAMVEAALIGYGVGQNLTGNSNTLVGDEICATNCTSANNNTIIGHKVASTTLVSGSLNILIGASSAVDTPAAGTSNFLNIGNLVEGDLSIGHFVLNGTAPGVTAGSTDCGTAPAISGNDNVGLVTVGSSTNGGKCTVTFHTGWTTAPVCLALNQTTGNLLRPTSTTTTLVLNGTLTAADKLSFMCKGYQL